MNAHRESWKSQVGFMLAAMGSAVGLANIWRFPYIVGENGGGAFIVLYVLCLLLVGFPVLISELILGRKARLNPYGAFKVLGKTKPWKLMGSLTLVTAFLVTSFYSVIAGWICGYFIEALRGNLHNFQQGQETYRRFQTLLSQPMWTLFFHALFMIGCGCFVLRGVRKGIEKGTKLLMPIFLIIMLILLAKGLSMEKAKEGLSFLLKPNWSLLTPAAFLMALGHAFFTLSLGQGTMITYGSYLSSRDKILWLSIPVVLADTLFSLLGAMMIFSIAFSAGIAPDAGPGLIFQTLPLVFSQFSHGYLLSILFFALVLLAAITSQISVMEPLIAYLMDQKKMTRKRSVIIVMGTAFVWGIPCALSFSFFKEIQVWSLSIFSCFEFLTQDILIPIGGLCVLLLVGWKWKIKKALQELKVGTESIFLRFPILDLYFKYAIKYIAPIWVIIIFLDALGVL